MTPSVPPPPATARTTPCPRLAEVDAARDGRLDATARAALVHHLRDCAACRARSGALAEIGRALAELPVAERDAFAARRGRHRLLAAFGGSPAPRRRIRWLAVAAAVAAAAVAAWSALRAPAPAGTGRSEVTVVATSARWERRDEAVQTVVRLDDGELALRVVHGADRRRLVVKLPDGELHDLGTSFRIRVERGRTAAIAVDDGAVVLRRPGLAEVMVAAGERWVAEPLVPAVAAAPPMAPPPAAPAATPTVELSPPVVPSPPSMAPPAAAPSASEPPVAPSPPPVAIAPSPRAAAVAPSIASSLPPVAVAPSPPPRVSPAPPVAPPVAVAPPSPPPAAVAPSIAASPPPVAGAPSPPPRVSPAPPPRSPSRAPAPPRRAAVSPPAPDEAQGAPGASRTSPPTREATAAEFRAAVAMLDAGHSAEAAAALRAFVARHAGDPRTEDASYLLVLALQRAGDAAAMREAARAYLARYPDGFRRAQVEPLAR